MSKVVLSSGCWDYSTRMLIFWMRCSSSFTGCAITCSGASDEDRGKHEELTEVPAHKRRRGGRRPLPENLPRQIVELLPADEDLHCQGCDTEKTRIGEDRTEELDYVPAS